MSVERRDLDKLFDRIEEQLNRMYGDLAELRRQVATLEVPDPTRVLCPSCGGRMPGPRRLAEHLENVHGLDREQIAALGLQPPLVLVGDDT